MVSESLPWPVTLALCVDLTRQISAADKETLDGLEKAGFKLEFGIDGAGILRLIVTRGGGYYIDFGCSQLIIDGKIKIKHCPEGIAGFEEDGLLLNDGSKLDADLVVLATGYDNMRESVRKVLGAKVADRCKDVWDLDEEGELKTVSSPLPNFVFHRLTAVRFGAQAAIQTSGLWVGAWLCAVFTPNLLRYRLPPPKQASRPPSSMVFSTRIPMVSPMVSPTTSPTTV